MLYIGGMFAAGAIGGVWLEHRNKTRAVKEFEKAVKDKWKILMDSMEKSKSENKIEQTYEMLEIIPKHYGFLSIIKIPYGKDSTEIQKLITRIEVVYGARVIIEPSSTDYKTCYMRVHLNGFDIEFKDDVKFRWYATFKNTKYRNDRGETYRLHSATDIKHPSWTKENKKCVGTRFKVSIPTGLKFSDLKSQEIELSKMFGLVQIDFDEKNKTTVCEVIFDKLGDKEPFSTVKVKPYEFYVGMEYSWKPIVIDTEQSPHLMIAGTTGGGKTYSIIMGLINLMCNCSEEEVEFYILSMSEKPDLFMFENVKYTRYYANNKANCKELLRYMKKEMKRRNELFSQIPFCNNIHIYNKKVKKSEKLPFMWLASDEIADLMDLGQEMQDVIWDLIRKCRNVGINIIMGSQRFSTNNLSAESKAQLSNKLIYKMANSASATTVVSGENLVPRVCSLMKREFLSDTSDGIKIGKTLYIDEVIMEKYIMQYQGDRKYTLKNGEIFIKTDKKQSRFEKNQENKKKKDEEDDGKNGF